MIDWNNDGRVDPTEVVLTDIILELQDEDVFIDDERDCVLEGKESWIKKLLRKRKDA